MTSSFDKWIMARILTMHAWRFTKGKWNSNFKWDYMSFFRKYVVKKKEVLYVIQDKYKEYKFFLNTMYPTCKGVLISNVMICAATFSE